MWAREFFFELFAQVDAALVRDTQNSSGPYPLAPGRTRLRHTGGRYKGEHDKCHRRHSDSGTPEEGEVRTCRVRCWKGTGSRERLKGPGEDAARRRRDSHAGAPTRRGERGRHVPRPGDGRSGYALHAPRRRPAPCRRPRQLLPSRPVRDRSGESVAPQGDPGAHPRGRDRRGDRRDRGHPRRAGPLVRGARAARARVHGPAGAACRGTPAGRAYAPRPDARRAGRRAADPARRAQPTRSTGTPASATTACGG